MEVSYPWSLRNLGGSVRTGSVDPVGGAVRFQDDVARRMGLDLGRASGPTLRIDCKGEDKAFWWMLPCIFDRDDAPLSPRQRGPQLSEFGFNLCRIGHGLRGPMRANTRRTCVSEIRLRTGDW
jgi:hypothetical protein